MIIQENYDSTVSYIHCHDNAIMHAIDASMHDIVRA